MNVMLEQPGVFQTKKISDLNVGDKLVNLGEIQEIMEKEESIALVILRMNQRQVWTFGKEDELVTQ